MSAKSELFRWEEMGRGCRSWKCDRETCSCNRCTIQLLTNDRYMNVWVQSVSYLDGRRSEGVVGAGKVIERHVLLIKLLYNTVADQ